jgi:hypothetical protein
VVGELDSIAVDDAPAAGVVSDFIVTVATLCRKLNDASAAVEESDVAIAVLAQVSPDLSIAQAMEATIAVTELQTEPRTAKAELDALGLRRRSCEGRARKGDGNSGGAEDWQVEYAHDASPLC